MHAPRTETAAGDAYTPFRVKTAARTATPKTPRSSRGEQAVASTS
jgi:hypothetical protein